MEMCKSLNRRENDFAANAERLGVRNVFTTNCIELRSKLQDDSLHIVTVRVSAWCHEKSLIPFFWSLLFVGKLSPLPMLSLLGMIQVLLSVQNLVVM